MMLINYTHKHTHAALCPWALMKKKKKKPNVPQRSCHGNTALRHLSFFPPPHSLFFSFSLLIFHTLGIMKGDSVHNPQVSDSVYKVRSSFLNQLLFFSSSLTVTPILEETASVIAKEFDFVMIMSHVLF